MSGLDNKISNVLGVALPYWLKKQIKTRSSQNNLQDRTEQNINHLGNKTGWIRVVSSINISNDTSILGQSDLKYFRDTLGIDNLNSSEDLAKNYILFGGTSKYLNNNQQLRSGLGFDNSYGILGDQEIKKYGYRPMPGIVDATIETQGKLGSIKLATINFKVWNKAQLDVIDALYFKLGYSMLIEWGNTVYVTSDDHNEIKYNYSEFKTIDPFQKSITKEQILIKINQNIRQTEGNYDGMLGLVYNFNFSMNSDGGYDCTLKVMGIGAIGDAIKINNTTNLPNVLKLQIKKYVDLINKKQQQKQAALIQTEQNKVIAENQKALDEKLKSLSNQTYYDILNTQDILKQIGNDTQVYQSDIPVTDIQKVLSNGVKTAFSAQDSSLATYTIPQLDKVDFYLETPAFALAKLKNFLYADAINAQNTSIYLNLNKLNNEINVPGTGKTNLPSDFTDLLVYDPSYDIKSVKIDQLIGLSSNQEIVKSNFNTIQNTYLTTGTGGKPGYENYGIGSRKTNVALNNEKDFFVNWIQYSHDNVIYRAELSIPLYSEVDTLTKTRLNLFSTINSKGDTAYNDITDAKINGNITIKNIIANSLKNNKDPWFVDTEYKYNDNSINSIENPDIKSPGIYKDTATNNNKITLGLLLYKFIDSGQIPIIYQTQKKVTNLSGTVITTEDNHANISFKIAVGLRINDAALLENFVQQNTIQTYEGILRQLEIDKNQVDINVKNSTQLTIEQSYSDIQTENAFKSQSNLELILKSIELYSLTKAVSEYNLDIGNTIRKYSLSGLSKQKNSDKYFLDTFKYGLFSPFINDLISNNIKIDSNYKSGEDYINNLVKLSDSDRLKLFAKYGFNMNYIAGHEIGSDYNKTKGIPTVDYDELTTVYVVPYDISDSIENGVAIIHPTYIQLGFLLMILNHMCTMYESDSSDTKTNKSQDKPLSYIDYNPETNFCLSHELQISTNPIDFLIPLQSNFNAYKTLFSEDLIENNNIKATDKGSKMPLFNASINDTISDDLPKFRVNSYQGKIMKILINIEYILKIIKEFSMSDGTSAVYLKPFLEKIINDINNYLGGMNVFRLSYNDTANCYCIVDDQIQPLNQNEIPVNQVDDEIPIYGLSSIAKSYSINTNIGSNLGNYIAISANANVKDQSANSVNASSVGFINNSFLDRYIPTRGDLTNFDKNPNAKNLNYDSQIINAQRFNQTIINTYGILKPTRDDIYAATNYYIEKMTKVTNQTGPTRASTMIHLAVDINMNGLSGFNMMHAFTIPPETLPYTYTARQTPTTSQMISKSGLDTKIAFAVVGLSHKISNNTWDTSVRGQMIMIKDQNIFTSKLNNIYKKEKLAVPPNTNFDPHIADITHYGYITDPTRDPNSLKGIGNRNNKLSDGSSNQPYSVALLDSTAKALNLKSGDKLKVYVREFGQTIIASYDDTIPPYIKLPSGEIQYYTNNRIDFYNPTAYQPGGTFKFVGYTATLEKI